MNKENFKPEYTAPDVEHLDIEVERGFEGSPNTLPQFTIEEGVW